jgi:starvation-inducible DNA-binding protein
MAISTDVDAQKVVEPRVRQHAPEVQPSGCALLTRIPTIDDVLNGHAMALRDDFLGYRNHVYRLVNLCVAIVGRSELEKIAVAAAFHDLGIWTKGTFDYIAPSIALAHDYLAARARQDWTAEIEWMIADHHKITRSTAGLDSLIEAFRRADWIDVTRGLRRFGVPRPFIAGLKGAQHMTTIDADEIIARATPAAQQQGHEFQPFSHLVKMPIALAHATCAESVENLNQLLADTITLRDLYKKHHWQLAGPTFYQLHPLFDKHYDEQNELVDRIAERIQVLGGVSIAMAPDVAEITLIPRLPKGREDVPVQISRLLHAHEIVLKEARTMARLAVNSGDDGTNDLIVSDVIRRNELQAWFVAEHVVSLPLTHAK